MREAALEAVQTIQANGYGEELSHARENRSVDSQEVLGFKKNQS
jgi:hypothetical protein